MMDLVKGEKDNVYDENKENSEKYKNIEKNINQHLQ